MPVEITYVETDGRIKVARRDVEYTVAANK
jgi:hypothetical protein